MNMNISNSVLSAIDAAKQMFTILMREKGENWPFYFDRVNISETGSFENSREFTIKCFIVLEDGSTYTDAEAKVLVISDWNKAPAYPYSKGFQHKARLVQMTRFTEFEWSENFNRFSSPTSWHLSVD